MTFDGDKGAPLLREWELNENSTKYEKNLAAPDDDEMVIYWSLWSFVAYFSLFFIGFILVGMLSSKSVRKQTFNMYLIYLMVPDFMLGLLCGTTCLMNAIDGSYWSHQMCNFQQWYLTWSVGSNCWLNGIIVYQLHKLLRYGHQRRKFIAPTPRQVTFHAIAVYLYCGFLGCWGLIRNAPNFPFQAVQVRGLSCLPVDMDATDTLFLWAVFMPLFALLPLGYVVYALFDIYKNHLLPAVGRRRILAIYFARIIAVFLVLWGPYLLLFYMLAPWIPIWGHWLGGLIAHFQGPISAGMSLLKPDIYGATARIWRGELCKGQEEEEREGTIELQDYDEIPIEPDHSKHKDQENQRESRANETVVALECESGNGDNQRALSMIVGTPNEGEEPIHDC